ncbi:hypothetical protein XENOCAPTIV_027111, partial [Xenoophorus captivus]
WVWLLPPGLMVSLLLERRSYCMFSVLFIGDGRTDWGLMCHNAPTTLVCHEERAVLKSCHGSCSECRGPTQQECLSCSDPAALLKDGVCVFDCGAGYYNQEGICYACDSSCASCFPDNPKCMSCPTGTALHHGKCITQCPTQHYVDNHSRCRACHSSCATCWGPSVSHCISCPSGLLLHQGQCVEACGEGLYPQDSTCHSED